MEKVFDISINHIWVVIPAYNEAPTLTSLLHKTRAFAQNIVIINDGSTDLTEKVAQDANVKVVTHLVQLGKGAALKTGCEYAIQQGARYIITLDGDAQHDPQDIPRFTECLKNYDIVFGYRELNKNMPLLFRFGNWLLSKMIETLYGLTLVDTQSGYRAFSKETYTKIKWNSSDYFTESEMIMKTKKNKLTYCEIPIKTIYLDKYKGTTVFDGMKIMAYLLTSKILKRR